MSKVLLGLAFLGVRRVFLAAVAAVDVKKGGIFEAEVGGETEVAAANEGCNFVTETSTVPPAMTKCNAETT